MPTPIYSLPFHTIAQMRAVAGLLRAYIDDHAPDTNEGEDWTPPDDLAEVSAAACHLEAAIEAHDKPADHDAPDIRVVSLVSIGIPHPVKIEAIPMAAINQRGNVWYRSLCGITSGVMARSDWNALPRA
jgi:hypothetical protein